MMPRHRRCTRPRHHVWTYRGPRFGVLGWRIARCQNCGLEDIA